MPTTVKHVSYAGVTVPLVPAFLEDRWMRIVHDQSQFRAENFWNFDANTDSLPTPSIPDRSAFRLNILSWPTGAVQPAFYNCLVNTNRLTQIKTAAGSTSSPQPLVLFDGNSGQTVTAQMYALPERALNNLGSDLHDFWLLTLVDRRFYDAWRRGFIAQPVSYTHLYAQIATIFGTAIAPDAVNSAYGAPSAKWITSPNVNLLTVLDAAAANCGQRVVYGLDGTIKTVNWETARAAADLYVQEHPRVISGGLTPESSIARYVPESVSTCFVDASGATVSTTPRVVDVTLVSLAISQYGAAPGVSGTKQVLNGDLIYTGSNTSALANYASAAAEDWYGWRLPDLDTVYFGIEPWAPTGWEDFIEWTMKLVEENPALPPSDEPPPGYKPLTHTHVFRGPWSDFQSGNFLAGIVPIPSGWIPSGGSGSGSGSGSGAGGCSEAVDPVEFDCTDGIRTATVNSIAVGVRNNQLVAEVCDSTDFDLGPCSPVTPGGTTIPLAQKVCPVYTAIQYLDWDSSPQSVRVVTGITVERVLVTVPIADPAGCTTFDPADCCGSGSGSGGGSDTTCDGCSTTCPECPNGVSNSWSISRPDEYDVEVCKLLLPNDGNECRWIEEGGRWELKFLADQLIWVVVNYDTGDVWFATISSWDCTGVNIMEPDEGNEDHSEMTLNPSANCDSSPITTDCCGSAPTPRTLTAQFSAGAGTMAALDGTTVTLVYATTNPFTGASGSGWYGSFNSDHTYWLSMVCFGGSWLMNGSAVDAACPGSTGASSVTCDPVNLVFNGFCFAVCRTGGATITVVEV